MAYKADAGAGVGLEGQRPHRAARQAQCKCPFRGCAARPQTSPSRGCEAAGASWVCNWLQLHRMCSACGALSKPPKPLPRAHTPACKMRCCAAQWEHAVCNDFTDSLCAWLRTASGCPPCCCCDPAGIFSNCPQDTTAAIGSVVLDITSERRRGAAHARTVGDQREGGFLKY